MFFDICIILFMLIGLIGSIIKRKDVEWWSFALVCLIVIVSRLQIIGLVRL